MEVMIIMNKSNLTNEWIELIKYAMNSNTSKEKFKLFLKIEKEKRKKLCAN